MYRGFDGKALLSDTADCCSAWMNPYLLLERHNLFRERTLNQPSLRFCDYGRLRWHTKEITPFYFLHTQSLYLLHQYTR